MRRPTQRLLTAALLPLGFVSLLLQACGGDPPKDPEQMTGPEMFLANCARCHGRAGEGSFMAPELSRIGDHWDVERLSRYLRDPEKVIAEDERLQLQGRRYSQRMPPFPQLSPAQRTKLAEWVLSSR
jgi:mono/diheme cytochrome c family protein